MGNKNVNAALFQPVYKEPDEMASEFHNNKTQTFTGKSALAIMFSAIILARLDPKYEQKRQKERDGHGLH